MPVGAPGGGPLEVTLDQDQLDTLSTELFQRARLPLDQACWTAGGYQLVFYIRVGVAATRRMMQGCGKQWIERNL